MIQKRVIQIIFFLFLPLSGCIPGQASDNFIEDTDPSGAALSASIGYIGCSNTRETVEGYHYLGGKKMWDYERRYGSGTILDWSKDPQGGSIYWEVFDELLEKNPDTKTIWWQLCIMDKERATGYGHASVILGEIRKRVPDALIYVSALADYSEGVCSITGTWGLEKGKELAEEIDAKNADVFLGPILGPMSAKETAKDGCHLSSPDGKRKLGNQMRQFFDDISSDAPKSVLIEQAIEIKNAKEEKRSENIKQELSSEEQLWRQRIESAMAPAECPEISTPEYPDSYYQGPLIDTHLHIPAIPTWPLEDEEEANEEVPEGRFGGPQALLGWNIKMSDIACTIKREGTMKNFAFFPVYEGEISPFLLEIWNRTMGEYPEQFTPFIMSSGDDGKPDGFPTVDAKTLKEMLAIYPGLFDGYGEIGLYARENGGSAELPPNSQRLLDIYPLIREHNLAVYLHLGEGQKDSFEKVLTQNPDINFIWHGDQLSVKEVEDILSRHPNAYYGVDAFWGHERELFLLFVGKSKEEYLERLNAKFSTVLNFAIDDWKAAIERHPDQFLWGIDRGDAVWNYDLEVGQMQVKLARAFIGRLDPNVQEKIAYKNAKRLVGMSGESG